MHTVSSTMNFAYKELVGTSKNYPLHQKFLITDAILTDVGTLELKNLFIITDDSLYACSL